MATVSQHDTQTLAPKAVVEKVLTQITSLHLNGSKVLRSLNQKQKTFGVESR